MKSSKYIVNKTSFYSIILLPIFFVYGYLLITPYTEGDQEYYRIFEQSMRALPYFEEAQVHMRSAVTIQIVSTYL